MTDTIVIRYSERGRQIQETAQKIIASWPEWKQRYAEDRIEPLANRVNSVKETLYNTEESDEVSEKARKILEEMSEWQRRYADEIIEQALSKEESKLPRMLE